MRTLAWFAVQSVSTCSWFVACLLFWSEAAQGTTVYDDGGYHTVDQPLADVWITNRTSVELVEGGSVSAPRARSVAIHGVTVIGASVLMVSGGSIRGGDTDTRGGVGILARNGRIVHVAGITRGGNGQAGGQGVFVEGGSALLEGGSIQGGNDGAGGAYGVWLVSTDVKITGGSVQAPGNAGVAVRAEGSRLEISGGDIRGASSALSATATTLIVTGGTLSSHQPGTGLGLEASDSQVILRGGRFEGGSGRNSGGHGIRLSGCSFLVQDAIGIGGEGEVSGGDGIAIYGASNGTITGGTFQAGAGHSGAGNSSSGASLRASSGARVYVQGGDFSGPWVVSRQAVVEVFGLGLRRLATSRIAGRLADGSPLSVSLTMDGDSRLILHDLVSTERSTWSELKQHYRE